MTRAFQTTEFDESWATEEIDVSGDLAYQRGTFVVVSRPKAGGAESRITGNFLRIYRKVGRRLVHGARLVQQPTAAERP